jgi:hypothetical protein
MIKDDFVGGCELRGFELVGKNNRAWEYPLFYVDNDQMVGAGSIKFVVNSPSYS